MSEMIDHIAYLSQEIGPRPIGTEEEQQAAAYIAEALKKEAGLDAQVEDISGIAMRDVPTVILCAVSAIFAFLAMVLPFMRVPAFILCLIAAVLFALEAFDKPVLSRFFSSGVSQNVVARYEPPRDTNQGSPRRRKVVLVARYDSGKVRAELNGGFAAAIRPLKIAELAAMVLLPVLALIRAVPLANAEGAPIIVLNILSAICIVIVLLPIVAFIVHRRAQYNEAANGSASGPAMLIELARRIGRAQGMPAPADGAVMHGQDAALASGLVPEGAKLTYTAAYAEGAETPVKAPKMAPRTEAERLASAKAAIAALSGKPVAGAGVWDISDNLVQVDEQPIAYDTEAEQKAVRDETREALTTVPADTVSEAMRNAEAAEAAARELAMQEQLLQKPAAPQAAPIAAGEVPEWFTKAQKKAKRPADDGKPVQRSRYASALDAAVQESSGYFEQANAVVEQKLEQSLAAGKEEIREVKPPQWAIDAAASPQYAAGAQPPLSPMPSAGSFFQQSMASSFEEEPLAEAYDMESDQVKPAFDASLSEAAFSAGAVPADAAGVANTAEAPAAETANPEDVAAPTEEKDVAAPAEENLAPEAADEPFSPKASLYAVLKEQAESEEDIPSFLNPWKVQEEARAAQSDEPRTSSRVNVTADPSARTGKIDVSVQPSWQVAQRTQAGQLGQSEQTGQAVQAAQVRQTPQTAQTAQPETPMQPASAGMPAGDAAVLPAESQQLTQQLSPVSAGSAPEAAQAARPVKKPTRRRAIDLPDVGGDPHYAPVSSLHKQRAPLAESSSLGETLPSVEGAQDMPDNKRQALRSLLPSLSGVIKPKDEPEEKPEPEPTHEGIGFTGSFAPVSEELLSNVDPNDIYVDDADDSAYAQDFTETGAYAGAGYVDMPTSRVSRFFGKFKKKSKAKDQVESTQEWLDVDEDFDARTVGKERGGWESFRQDNAEAYDFEAPVADEVWSAWEDSADTFAGEQQGSAGAPGAGGVEDAAFNAGVMNGAAATGASAAGVPATGAAATGADDDLGATVRFDPLADDADFNTFFDEPAAEEKRGRFPWRGGAFSADMRDAALNGGFAAGSSDNLGTSGADGFGAAPVDGFDAAFAAGLANDTSEANIFAGQSASLGEFAFDDMQEQRDAVWRFRNAAVTTEVWFVALGAELEGNAGMKAFLAEHAQDLRGAVIIDVDSLGAGEFSLIDREGVFRTARASSRMKRFLKKATQATGVRTDTASIRFEDSAASVAAKSGFQAMHLVGMSGGKPALYAQADDTVENLDAALLDERASFLMEFVKAI